MLTIDEHAPENGARSFAAGVTAVVAIPVCNERAHIVGCLEALDAQRGQGVRFGVLLFLNNCTDGTENVVAAMSSRLSFPLEVVECAFAEASAGWARRRAMDGAAAWLDEGNVDGILLTTDADSRVPPDWIARNLAALEAGADAVAGRLALDPNDAAALPAELHARGAMEAEYEALLIEIVARLDPCPGNPWPHHWCRSGASLAVTLSTYRAIGGMPNIPLGEDRAFVEAVLAHDGVVRHDPDLVVVTSGRLDGRAKGGVADTIRLRCQTPESHCDDRLERLERVIGRALLRRRLRGLHARERVGALHRWARVLGAGTVAIASMAPEARFGAFHAMLEGSSTRLRYKPLRPADLRKQIERATAAVRLLRAVARGTGAPRVQPTIPDAQAIVAADAP